MFDVKKDIRIPVGGGSDLSKGYHGYLKDHTKLGFGFNNVDPNSQDLNLQLKIYSKKTGEQLNSPQTGHLNISRNVLIANGQSVAVENPFKEFYPEVTAKALAIVKQLTFAEGVVGDYI
jgi:hypothetical protein